jgi:hypothetical protein
VLIEMENDNFFTGASPPTSFPDYRRFFARGRPHNDDAGR